MSAPSFSIVLVTHNRELLLKKCLDSIFHQVQACPHVQKSLEDVVVIFNGEGDVFELDYPVTRMNLTKKQTPAGARNLASEKVSSDYILFLDDDCLLGPDYLSKSLEILGRSSADVLGGPDQPYPDISNLEKTLNLALMSPMATSVTRKRHSVGREEEFLSCETSLTLCNLWVKTSGFRQHGFSTDFMRGEENELLQRWRPQKILYSSQIFVFHKRRDSFRGMMNATFVSGVYRAKLISIHGIRDNWVFVTPLVGLLVMALFLFFQPSLAGAVLGAYLLMSLLTSFYIAGRDFLAVAFMQISINIFYTWGLVVGICSSFHHFWSVSHFVTKSSKRPPSVRSAK